MTDTKHAIDGGTETVDKLRDAVDEPDDEKPEGDENDE